MPQVAHTWTTKCQPLVKGRDRLENMPLAKGVMYFCAHCTTARWIIGLVRGRLAWIIKRLLEPF